MKELLIGTTNHSKIEFYRQALRDYDFQIVLPNQYPAIINVPEDLFDIRGNSVKKATTFAQITNVITLSDDTGIFIPALNYEPGVAVRRWAGNLPETVSDEDWIRYFLEKISSLRDDELECYKHQVITVSTPGIKHSSIDIITKGRVLNDVQSPVYHKGGPFSAFFYLDEFGKTEANLTEEEMDMHTQEVKGKVLILMRQLVT